MKLLRWVYPSVVGLLLGLLQTGLFFQLSFALSSSFRTFLMVTVCWLVGSVIGIALAPRTQISLNGFVVLAVSMYFTCVLLLRIAPFKTDLWPTYALLIVVTGFYPGVFFVRFGDYYPVRTLFFRENNGFIFGIVAGTLAFLLLGRTALWIIPTLTAVVVMYLTRIFLRTRALMNV